MRWTNKRHAPAQAVPLIVIYVRPKESYLKPERTRNVIELPIVYQTTPFADRFKPIMLRYFSSKNGLWHYLHMAEGNYKEFLQGDMVKAKKYFYVPRPILACRWILEKESPPPMLFSELMESQLPERLKTTVRQLLELKVNSPEVKTIPRTDLLNEYTESIINSRKAARTCGSLYIVLPSPVMFPPPRPALPPES